MAKRSAPTKAKAWPCTKEAILQARDTDRLSWKAVGATLGIGSPSAARAAYTALTGVPHYESQPIVARAPKGTGRVAERKAAVAVDVNPGWNADTDQDDIIAKLTPGTAIIVQRQFMVEEMVVHELRGFAFNKDESRLILSFFDGFNGALRSVYVDAILEVR